MLHRISIDFNELKSGKIVVRELLIEDVLKF